MFKFLNFVIFEYLLQIQSGKAEETTTSKFLISFFIFILSSRLQVSNFLNAQRQYAFIQPSILTFSYDSFSINTPYNQKLLFKYIIVLVKKQVARFINYKLNSKIIIHKSS